MKKSIPMAVRQIEGEPYRFHVGSSEGRELYLVDLLENQGNGKCNCMDFQTRRQPCWDAGGRGSPAQCKHIRSARWNLFLQIADEMFVRIAEQQTKDERSQDDET